MKQLKKIWVTLKKLWTQIRYLMQTNSHEKSLIESLQKRTKATHRYVLAASQLPAHSHHSIRTQAAILTSTHLCFPVISGDSVSYQRSLYTRVNQMTRSYPHPVNSHRFLPQSHWTFYRIAITSITPSNHQFSSSPGGGIGRHAGLRSLCLNSMGVRVSSLWIHINELSKWEWRG